MFLIICGIILASYVHLEEGEMWVNMLEMTHEIGRDSAMRTVCIGLRNMAQNPPLPAHAQERIADILNIHGRSREFGISADRHGVFIRLLRATYSRVVTHYSQEDLTLVYRVQAALRECDDNREVSLQILLTNGCYVSGGLPLTTTAEVVYDDSLEGNGL